MRNAENTVYNVAGNLFSVNSWTTSTRYAVFEHTSIYGFVSGPNEYIDVEGLDRWYNRPWYERRYQNARVDAAGKIMSGFKAAEKAAWMDERGYKRMTARRKEEYAAAHADEVIPTTDGRAVAYALYYLLKCSPDTKSADDAAHVLSVLERLESVKKADGGLYKFTADDGHGFIWAARQSTYDFSNVKFF